MKQHWKRLLTAALTSSSVFGLTVSWYKLSASSDSEVNDSIPLAYIERIQDDLQKRAATRLLWQSVEKGDPLYDGEAIRTGSRGEARIIFADSESYLDLEADSIIVLKKAKGEISLDLLEGNLFVKAQSEEGSSIVLNSQDGKVELSKTSASISRQKGKALDLEVLAGQATIKDQRGTSQTVTVQNDLKVLLPNPDQALIISAEQPQPLYFEWQAVTQADQYKFFAGATREKMKLVQTTQNLSLPVALKAGKHYWKIEAHTIGGQKISQTPTFRSEVIERYTPIVLSPKAESEIVGKNNISSSIVFKWQNPSEIKSVKIELYEDADLTKLVSAKNFTPQEESFTFNNITYGTYHWRIFAQFNDSDLQIASKPQTLTLISPENIKPVLIHLTSESREQIFNYGGPAKLVWSADRPDLVTKWKVNISAETNPKKTVTRLETAVLEIKPLLPHSGRYTVTIEAYNSSDLIIGTTTENLVLIEPPLLAAPTFSPASGTLTAAADGQATVTWEGNPDAGGYLVTVTRNDKVMSEKVYDKPSARFKNLLPGEYQIQAVTIDKYQRRGPASVPRTLVVPDTSDLKAPSFKKVKVN